MRRSIRQAYKNNKFLPRDVMSRFNTSGGKDVFAPSALHWDSRGVGSQTSTPDSVPPTSEPASAPLQALPTEISASALVKDFTPNEPLVTVTQQLFRTLPLQIVSEVTVFSGLPIPPVYSDNEPSSISSSSASDSNKRESRCKKKHKHKNRDSKHKRSSSRSSRDSRSKSKSSKSLFSTVEDRIAENNAQFTAQYSTLASDV